MTNYGGAESVISAFHDLYPNAPIYTTMYKPGAMRELGQLKNVKSSWLDAVPFAKHQWMISFMPLVVERMNLDEFDVVLSSCHSVSKGIITKPSTLHISYCHTPMRYAWESWDFETRLKHFPKFLHSTMRRQIEKMRVWDACAAQRVDVYIANSSHIKSKIKEHYKRDSTVIYPPVRTERFEVAEDPTADYYLATGRLIPYKKFDLLIETFNQLKFPLKIAGTGPDLDKLKKMAGPTVELLGYVSDTKLKELYANCKGFLFPQQEDAGIVPLEAMASGRPVIAYSQGGSRDTMMEGITGILFNEQSVDALSEAIGKFEKVKFNPKQIRRHAEQFDIDVFKQKIADFVEEEWQKFRQDYAA